MSKIDDIKEIIQLVMQSPIHEFSLEYEDIKIAYKKPPLQSQSAAVNGELLSEALAVTAAAAAAVQAEPANAANAVDAVDAAASTAFTGQETSPQLKELHSSMFGTFYSSAEPGSPSFVQVGDRVTEDTVVGMVEAMKLFHEVQAEMTGEITAILVEHGQLVEFGQPLFLIKPN